VEGNGDGKQKVKRGQRAGEEEMCAGKIVGGSTRSPRSGQLVERNNGGCDVEKNGEEVMPAEAGEEEDGGGDGEIEENEGGGRNEKEEFDAGEEEGVG
jgi:hypothetical protein